jgi:hypothetical protein
MGQIGQRIDALQQTFGSFCHRLVKDRGCIRWLSNL